MPYSFQLTPRYFILLVLFMINLVHIMISIFFQIPGNFLNLTFEGNIFWMNTGYFGLALITCFCYPMIVRRLSLKTTLLVGLIFDMIGLSSIWLSVAVGGNLPLVLISTLTMGMALLTVVNCIITYLVIEFPQKLGIAIMSLFAFGSVGDMLANLFFNAFNATRYNDGFFVLAMILLVVLIYFIATRFFDPPFPKHLEHLRRGTLIWKEFHYRIAFFMIATIGYGLVESVFTIWGEVYLLQYLTKALAVNTVSIFWFSMVIGQVLLLIPLYFIPARKIFPLLVIALIATIYFVERQTGLTGITICFAIAGFTCAAMLPIIMSSMEKELITASSLAHQHSFLPYVEIGTALLLGGYFLGVGLMDLYVLSVEGNALASETFFKWAIIVTAIIGLIILFLNWSSEDNKQERRR